MRYYPVILVLLLLSLFAACKGPDQIKDGTTAYELKRFHQAAPMLEQELTSTNNVIEREEKMNMIAESYRENNQTKQAAKWYKKLKEDFPTSEYYLLHAEALMRLEEYENAIEAYDQLKDFDPSYGRLVIKGIDACKEVLNFDKDRNNLRIIDLPGLNSSAADFAMVPYKRNQFVFTTSRQEAKGEEINNWTGEKYGDLFLTEKNNKGFSPAFSFDDAINTNYYEGTVSFNKDFSEMYFTKCGSESGLDDFCAIYSSNSDGGFWSEPEKISFFNDSTNCGQPFISADGRTLFFSADAEDGFGGKDIYFSIYQDTGWSFPTNAGTRVNSEKDEMFPTTDSKGKLYFSSNGHGGFGGLDIFKANKEGRFYKSIERLDYPINSGGDDFALIWTKEGPKNINDPVLQSGYFSSSRPGGKGRDDIYQFVYDNVNYFVLQGKVVEKNYSDPEDPDSKVLGLKPLDDAQVEIFFLPKENLEKTKEVGSDGEFDHELKVESDYRIFASKEGYFNKSTVISTKGKRSTKTLEVIVEVEIELEKIFPREITIPNIYYDLDKATLRSESLPVLDSVLTLFTENPDLTIEIGSHTDSRGNDKYNEELSQRRAQSVIDYLSSQGVNTDKLVAKGYGENKILNGCLDGVNCTEEQHQENRRTTFRVLLNEDQILKSE